MPSLQLIGIILAGWVLSNLGTFYAGKMVGHAEAKLESQAATITQAGEDTNRRDVWDEENVKAALYEQRIDAANEIVRANILADIRANGGRAACVRAGFLRNLEEYRDGAKSAPVEASRKSLRGSGKRNART